MNSDPQLPHEPRRRSANTAWTVLVIGHAAIVVGLTAFFAWAVASVPPEAGANIGAGLILMPILMLGLPWTLPYLVDPYAFNLSYPAWLAVTVAPAFLNVALHWWLSRRSAGRGRKAPSA